MQSSLLLKDRKLIKILEQNTTALKTTPPPKKTNWFNFGNTEGI